jgi:hypothetical protein
MSKAGYLGWFVLNVAFVVTDYALKSWLLLPFNLALSAYYAQKYWES